MNVETRDCAAMQERLTGRLLGALAADELRELEIHLAGCPDCAAEAATMAGLWRDLGETGEDVPTTAMRARLDARIAAEMASAPPAPLPFQGRRTESAEPAVDRTPAPLARFGPGAFRRLLSLAAMLLVGLGLGYLAAGRQSEDVALLRREVGDLHSMVALSLLERGSVSERLQGVAYSRDYALGSEPGVVRGQMGESEAVIAALFARLLEDPDINVRLAALEALRPVADREGRRGELVAAVARQESPLVALSLIDLLLESDDAAARRDLEQLLANPQLDPVVRGYLRDRLGRSA